LKPAENSGFYMDQGIDPSRDKQAKKRRAYINASNTFKAIALEWHENQKGRWSEIDFTAKEWIIPAERMKMRRATSPPSSH